MTHTYAVLDVPRAVYAAVRALLDAAGYQHAFHAQAEGEVIDMHGQSVEVKAGIAMVGAVEVPNPVTLRPFRTFREVTQPESPFVVRLQERNGGMPTVSLFEADAGSWKLVAIQRVRDWLTEQLAGTNVAVLA